MMSDQATNPALDLPLTEIPHTLAMVIPGYVYYFQFLTEPGPDEYMAAVVAVGNRMAKELGVVPDSKDTIYRPTAEIRWEEIRKTLQSDPVRVA